MAYGTINADVIQSSVTGVSLGAGNATRFKNRIINGDMTIDQRNAGASITPTNGQYLVDRFSYGAITASKFTAQQNAGAVTPPVGFGNYLGLTSSSAYSIGSTDRFNLFQSIEGFNTAYLGFGTANAKTVTISFWVYSSLTGTFGGSLLNGAYNYSYPFSYTISAANTWEQKSITIAGPTAGTWVGATNGIGMTLAFGLGVGTSLSGTAGSWSANGYFSATGAVSVVGTSGATFYITGVQLEVGSSATGFEVVDYTTQLAMCQRYYYQLGGNSFLNPSSNAYQMFSSGFAFNTVAVDSSLPFKVPMRTTPTITQANTAVQVVGTIYAVSSITDPGSTPNVAFLRINTSGSFTAGNGAELLSNNNATGYVAFSAEL